MTQLTNQSGTTVDLGNGKLAVAQVQVDSSGNPIGVGGGATVVDTELPAAAALADNTVTPTAPAVGAFLMVYDGTTWDFLRGTAANGGLVDISRNQRVGTAVVTAVADNAASVTLLAANAARLGATIVNDSSARLYVKFGATATTASYTVSLGQHAYLEVPFGYTGIIDGIWASDPGDGAARITEFTA